MFFPDKPTQVVLRFSTIRRQVVGPLTAALHLTQHVMYAGPILCNITFEAPRPDYSFGQYRLRFHNTNLWFCDTDAASQSQYVIFSQSVQIRADDEERDADILKKILYSGHFRTTIVSPYPLLRPSPLRSRPELRSI